MNKKTEIIRNLKNGIEIMTNFEEKKEKIDKKTNKGGCLSKFISLVISALIWYTMVFILDINFFISTILFFVIAFIIDVSITIKQTQSVSNNPDIITMKKQISTLENHFKETCGFSIDKYLKYQLYEIIDLLESGEADTFKEAAAIIRINDQHNQLLEENRKLRERLDNTEKSLSRQDSEFKKMKKQNKNLHSKVNNLESEIDDLESEVDYYK